MLKAGRLLQFCSTLGGGLEQAGVPHEKKKPDGSFHQGMAPYKEDTRVRRAIARLAHLS